MELWYGQLSRLPGDFLSHHLQGTSSLPRWEPWRKGLQQPRGAGRGLESDPGLCVCPKPGAEILGLQLCWEKLGAAFSPLGLSGQLAEPPLRSSPAHGRSRGRGLGLSGRRVGEDGWKRTSCYGGMSRNSVSVCWARSTREAPAEGAGSASGSGPDLSHGDSESSGWRSGAWRPGARGPRSCWAVVVGKDAEVQGGPARPIRGRRRTRRCSGCPWWWGAPRGSA